MLFFCVSQNRLIYELIIWGYVTEKEAERKDLFKKLYLEKNVLHYFILLHLLSLSYTHKLLIENVHITTA